MSKILLKKTGDGLLDGCLENAHNILDKLTPDQIKPHSTEVKRLRRLSKTIFEKITLPPPKSIHRIDPTNGMAAGVAFFERAIEVIAILGAKDEKSRAYQEEIKNGFIMLLHDPKIQEYRRASLGL